MAILDDGRYLFSVAAQRIPTISHITQEQVKDIGESVELQCSVQYAQEYPIMWIKVNKHGADQVPISTNTGLMIRDSRFSLKHDTGSSTYILQVRSIETFSLGGIQGQQESRAGCWHDVNKNQNKCTIEIPEVGG